MIHLGNGHPAECGHDYVALERSSPLDRHNGSAFSGHSTSLTRSGEPVSLLAGIAHELKIISGGSEIELRVRARVILTEAFRSLENHSPGAPHEDRATSGLSH